MDTDRAVNPQTKGSGIGRGTSVSELRSGLSQRVPLELLPTWRSRAFSEGSNHIALAVLDDVGQPA